MDWLVLPATPFLSPWAERLFAALAATEGRLLLVSPYIKEPVIAVVEGVLAERAERSATQPLSIRVLTRVRLDDLLAGSSDLAALERINRWPAAHPGWVVEARALDNLHAKVWVIDERAAFIGSGNATPPGLEDNVEYGIELNDQATVARILADWIPPWEQATRITDADLAAFHQALDMVGADEALRVAQREVDRRRAELTTRISAPTHIGSRLPIGKSGRLPAPPGAPPEPAAPGGIISMPGGKPSEPVGADFALELRLDHVLKALRWVVPGMDSAEGFAPRMSLFSALKLTCERGDAKSQTTSERAALLSQVRLTWADHVRDVEAALVAFAIASEAVDAPVRGPWAVTLSGDAVQRLVAMLFRYQHQMPSESNVTLALRLSIEPVHTRLSLAVWRVTLEENADGILLEPPLAVDVTPAPWDEGLREAPCPAVTARVDATELDAALRLLHPHAPAGDTPVSRQPGAESRAVELRLDTFLNVMTLRLGGVRGATEQPVPLHDKQGSSAPAFRVGQQALFQMSHFRGVAGEEQTWAIRVPPHAEYIEFEPTHPLFIDGSLSHTQWRCRLRNVE